MAVVALGFVALYYAFALVFPLVAARRRTGASAMRSTPGGAGRISQLLFVVGNVLIVVGPLVDLAGGSARFRLIDTSPFVRVLGIVLAGSAIPLIVVSRRAMGASWRVGVDVDEHTDLVTSGPFARVRHPIYTAMLCLSTGIAMIVPNLMTFASVIAFLAAVEVQVRLIEDPYLNRTHREFAEYAEATGRFLPRVGRLTSRANS